MSESSTGSRRPNGKSFSRAKARLGPLDAVLIGGLVLATVHVWSTVQDNLHYRWNWGALPQYILRFDPETGEWVANTLLKGLFTTVRLSIWGGLLATLLGGAVGLCRVSHSLFRRLVGTTYVGLIRNTPPLVLVFITYFFLSDQILPLLKLDAAVRSLSPKLQGAIEWAAAPPARLSLFLSAVLTLAAYEGAYIAEIIRAGIQSVERGQWEASSALGFSRREQMIHIILPQAFQRILPPLAGQFISTIKDSAILSVISVQELTFRGQELMASSYLTFEIWITITLMYFALAFFCSTLVGRLERTLRSRPSWAGR